MSTSKIAMINGACGGMGFGIAQNFVEKGMSIIMLGRDSEKLNLAKTKLNKLSINNKQFIHSYAVDMNKKEDIDALEKYLWKSELKPDIFVNACGIVRLGGLHEVSDSEWLEAFQVNLINMTAMVTIVSNIMRLAQKRGSIILINGALSRQPEAALVINSTTTSAVSGFAKAISKDLGRHGIRVNVINPGVTRTPLYDEVVRQLADKFDVKNSEIEDSMKNKAPLQRIAEVDDVVNAVNFLCADESNYINGIFLTVDGGGLAAY